MSYDHNFVLDAYAADTLIGVARVLAARLYDPTSGRILEVSTTKPGIQVYTGNKMDQVITGKGGAYARHAGIALETQHSLGTPNQPAFPTTILRPWEGYFSETMFCFFVDSDSQLRT